MIRWAALLAVAGLVLATGLILHQGLGAIVAALAERLGRPVRWSDTREASFASTTHAGDQLHTATLALDRDGTILALVDDFLADSGAYLPRGAVIAGVTAPPGKKMGHAGAIISGSQGTAQAKMEALRKAGAQVAQNPTEAGELMAGVVQTLR